MKISWVFDESTWIDHNVRIEDLKNIGSFWGSWKTWRNCQTDNVICSDLSEARNLLNRKFNQACNFYIPDEFYVDLNRPENVRLFGGKFNFEIQSPDDIIAMHLASSQSDIVLLLGFDWIPKEKSVDKLQEHREKNYRNAVADAIKTTPEVQWVLIDHPETLMSEVSNLENLTIDTLPNVIKMLSS